HDYEKARTIFEAIPAADRNGDLAITPYLIADCLIRTAPTKIDDALAAGKLEEQLKGAAENLESYIGADAKAPMVPDALLKLGPCQQRMAGWQGQPPQRVQAFATARATYEKLMQQFPQHPLIPQAVLERAKCIAQQGDKGGAMNELRRFTGDPLKNSN